MTTFENVGRRRLTPKGSRAVKELELEVPDLKVGEGRILPTGEIAINDPKAGLIVLRADHVHTYIPKKAASNPLDGIVDVENDDEEQPSEQKAPPKTASADAPAKKASDEDDAPLIESESKGNPKLSADSMGSVTDGSGIGTSY